MGSFRNWVAKTFNIGSYKNITTNIVRQQRYWRNNSIYLENVYNKISVDIAMLKFKHIKVANPNEWQEFDSSELINLISFSPNDDETPINFWTNVSRSMIENGVAVVVPQYSQGKILSLELAVGNVYFDDFNVTLSIKDKEFTLKKSDVWIFENPKKNLSVQLLKITQLIDDNLRALSEKLSDGNNSTIKGFIKFDTKAVNETLKKRTQERIKAIQEVAQSGQIGWLEEGEDFKELTHAINTASSEELEFLKSQLYQAFGINEKLFTCDYSEMQFRAYYNGVLKIYLRVIAEEINKKYFTQTARTQGHKLLAFYDLFDLTSLKDLTEFADKMKYHAMMSPNEVRAIIGYSPYKGGETYSDNANAVAVNNVATSGN
jgi:HK97 family phage portal protein